MARTSACDGRHGINARLARCLLMAHDRAKGDTFAITHEFFAMMLGVRRAGITVAAGLLQQGGRIHDERGRITVMDRPGLERAACECCGVMRRTLDRLLAVPTGASPLMCPESLGTRRKRIPDWIFTPERLAEPQNRLARRRAQS